jgi:DNA modification methylase
MTAADVIAGNAAWAVECGDALDLLRRLPDGCVDVVVTDPPFGARAEEWDRMDSHEFARFSMAWLAEARRVGKELVSFCSAYGPFRALCEMLWPRVRVMVWDKPWGSQYAGAKERGLWMAHETILHCHQGFDRRKSLQVGRMIRAAREASRLSRGGVDMVIRGKKTGLCFRWEEAACLPTAAQGEELCSLLGLGDDFLSALRSLRAEADTAEARDVFSYRPVTNGNHPCQKPLLLMRELVERLTPPGSLVLDPFAGSGTTGLACHQTDRRFIGFEIDRGYAALAARRIAEDSPLFKAPPSPAPGLFDALVEDGP